VYYKVAPPNERNELNLSLLSSAPESEIGTNAPKDLGRPLTDFLIVFSIWYRNYPAKLKWLSFFDK